ncbi:hypothetical protein NQ315_006006 [Exocentrus adspersus]|uniref:Uncharacterized protein n=1 Tax=Exocentrus adspersus TaxID=1586481 RepID=A0AAV8VCD9_9CUCU|nr:hypothetical protein NQ315_006006 [Exocentrus adspersus]
MCTHMCLFHSSQYGTNMLSLFFWVCEDRMLGKLAFCPSTWNSSNLLEGIL